MRFGIMESQKIQPHQQNCRAHANDTVMGDTARFEKFKVFPERTERGECDHQGKGHFRAQHIGDDDHQPEKDGTEGAGQK